MTWVSIAAICISFTLASGCSRKADTPTATPPPIPTPTVVPSTPPAQAATKRFSFRDEEIDFPRIGSRPIGGQAIISATQPPPAVTTPAVPLSSSTPELIGLSITPSTVVSGQTYEVWADIKDNAPVGGVSIPLKGNGETRESIAIPEGHDRGGWLYKSGPGGTITFEASFNGVTKVASGLVVGLASITVTPQSVEPNGAFSVMAALTSAAPAGGVSVDICEDGNSHYAAVINEGDTECTLNYRAQITTSSSEHTFVASLGDQTATSSLSVGGLKFCTDMNGEDDDVPCYDIRHSGFETYGEWRTGVPPARNPW